MRFQLVFLDFLVDWFVIEIAAIFLMKDDYVYFLHC